ncbi:pumilio-like protein 5 [Iris pallida]|uniref:Pumilio-like protein 5 n=1 Tax=Iris pallida TaxID=29817 RepID=A0AAX6GZI3_IRIPA|nr:pumilio-like protein 5 [Iris pallida]
MATESAVRMIGTSGDRNWPIGKDTALFASSTGNATAQELGLLLQGQGFHGSMNIATPNRSGSAPPSMEGSSLAIGDLTRYQNSRLEGIFGNLSNAVETSESEEQLRADPAYHAYYYSNVNLNPRLPQPLVSRENQRLVHHIGGSGENWRMSSFDDSSKGSFISRPVLSTHKEEPEDDRLPIMDSKGKGQNNSGFISGPYTSPLQGRHKSLVDLIQEDFPRTPSPVYNNPSRLSSQGTSEQADSDSCVKPLQESSIKISKGESKIETVGVRARSTIPSAHSVGSSPNNDLVTSLIPCSTSSDVTVNPHPRRKGESSTSNANLNHGILPSDRGISSIGSIENETKSLRLSNDGHRGQPAFQHPQQDNLHSRGASVQVQIGQSQMVHQGMPSSNNADHFSHRQPKLPSSVQPVLQSAGSAPPLYATAASYGNHCYPNLQTSCLFPQFSIGGYMNTSLVPPFITGYPPYTTIQMPFEGPGSPNFNGRTSGLSGGNITPVADLQHLYKFYGQFGMTGQTSFTDPIYMPYFQHSSADAYTSVGEYDPMASRGSTIGSPASNYDPQRGPVLGGQRPQIVRSGGVNNPNVRKGGTTSPNHSGSPQNVPVLLPYPSSPLASPLCQGSSVTAGRRSENMRFQVNTGRTGGTLSGWQGQRSREKVDELKKHSFLEELKSSKSRKYELPDIAGHILEFRQCRSTWKSIYSAEARNLQC